MRENIWRPDLGSNVWQIVEGGSTRFATALDFGSAVKYPLPAEVRVEILQKVLHVAWEATTRPDDAGRWAALKDALDGYDAESKRLF